MKEKLAKVKNWKEFAALATASTAKERGDLFEILTKYYLLLDPTYRTDLSDVWLLTEVPQKVRTFLNLPDTDQGIDIVAKTKTGKYWAIQCKYRSSVEHSLTWREISTFTGLTFGVCKNIEFGLIAYTGERYAKVLDTAEHLSFLSIDVWSTLSDEFFKELGKALEGKKEELVRREPRPHQQRAIEKAAEYFKDKKNTRGKLIMPCGAGKSLTAFWLAETLKAKTIVVAVPSLSLIQQTLPVWLREYAARDAKGLRWLCVCSDQTVTKDTDSVVLHTQDLGYPCLTNKEDIIAWLNETNKATPRVIFTTYQSGKVLAEAVKEAGIVVDLGIMDEAHKTVGQKDKLFSHLLFDENLPMKRRIFMTATERRYGGQGDEIISMDDPKMYGEAFELLSFKSALEQDPPILSDYKIVTMVISEEDIANLISENRYVRPSGGVWNDEIEAQMLASMVALRKAMQKYPIKHAVSFHSSIARASAFAQFNDTYTSSNKELGELETFHVTGATPTATRKQTINAFAASKRGLITNARCLTEGVDVPNIDCVLFADPRQSTVDIVQAVGRALRPSKGKKFGYVIVPIISRSESIDSFTESGAFKSVMTVLRSLAANDERIIEYFRAINAGRKMSGKIVEIEIDEKISQYIDLQEFSRRIETQVWGKLARLSWRSYDDAIKFVHTLNLKSGKDWKKYIRGEFSDLLLPIKPADIPNAPESVYKEYYDRGGWGAWVGVDNRRGGWREISKAIQFVNSLGLKSGTEWTKYCNGEYLDLPVKPNDLPVSPYAAYKKSFHDHGGMAAWLGTKTLSPKYRKYLSYDEAVIFVRKLNIKNGKEWIDYTKGLLLDKIPKPDNIPGDPYAVYKDLFVKKGGMGSWLGTGSVVNSKRKYRTYEEARKYALKLGIKTSSEWADYSRGLLLDKFPKKPDDIPAAPDHVYKKEFKMNGGWAYWLGTENRKSGWRSFEEARKFVHELKIDGTNAFDDWLDYLAGRKSGLSPKPIDVPSTPDKVYKENWNGWVDWLGR